MTPAQESITAKFRKLEEATLLLESLRIKYNTLEKFLANPEGSSAVIYNLIIGVEAITDIGNHILAEKFQDYSERYRDILIKLGTHGVVPHEFAVRTADMANFRNLAIHVYEALTIEEVYRILERAPEDFRIYAKSLEPYL